MAVVVKWHGAELLRYGRKAAAAAIKAAGHEHLKIARQMASVPNTGVTQKVLLPDQSHNKTTRTIYPNSSKPGEPPRRRTGQGQKGIVGGTSEDGLSWRTGYTRAVRYMAFHELGIRYAKVGLQQRPTVMPALTNNINRLEEIARRVMQATRP